MTNEDFHNILRMEKIYDDHKLPFVKLYQIKISHHATELYMTTIITLVEIPLLYTKAYPGSTRQNITINHSFCSQKMTIRRSKGGQNNKGRDRVLPTFSCTSRLLQEGTPGQTDVTRRSPGWWSSPPRKISLTYVARKPEDNALIDGIMIQHIQKSAPPVAPCECWLVYGVFVNDKRIYRLVLFLAVAYTGR